MKVKVESFGGIVGHRQGERVGADLSAEQLSEIAKLKSTAPAPVVSGPGPHYRVTITDDQGVHQIDVREPDMPDSLIAISSGTP